MKIAKVALQFNFWVSSAPVPADFQHQLDRHLAEWRDGRYPLAVEMLRHAACEVVEASIGNSIDDLMRKKFPNEMVQTGEHSRTSRAHLETEVALKELKIHSRKDVRVIAAHAPDDSPEREGTWRVLCRDDRLPDGNPGPYALGSKIFAGPEAARKWAEGVSPSRFPIIVEDAKAEMVLGALNFKQED